jgi:hypothetical protein
VIMLLHIYSYNSGATVTSSTTVSTSATATPTASAIAGWSAIGCYSDVVGARTLNTQIYTIAGSAMTVELCTAACKSAGFTLSGLEYGGECYCDTTIMNTGTLVTDGCTMACNGNAAEICGGSNRLSVYSYNASSVTTSNAPTGTATSTGPTSTTSAVGVATSLPTGWAYKGCWLDQQYGRILGTQAPTSDTLTVESCVQACAGLGYSIAGMEYFTQCYCGNAMINQAVTAPEADCNTACGGNAAEMCGGGDRMSIYSNETTLKITPVPKVQATYGSWNYTGCLIDNAVTRTFPYQIEMLTNNTAENCLSQCQKFGYPAGGMEYAEQCCKYSALDIVAQANTSQSVVTIMM